MPGGRPERKLRRCKTSLRGPVQVTDPKEVATVMSVIGNKM